MTERTARGSRLALGAAALGILLGGGLLAGVALLASRERKPPGRCSPGLEERGARCCAPGQDVAFGRCVGEPRSCPALFRSTPSGCVAPAEAVFVAPGRATFGATDWDVASEERKTLAVRGFYLDRFEVTNDRYDACVATRECPALPGSEVREPGVPVVGLDATWAARFCGFAGDDYRRRRNGCSPRWARKRADFPGARTVYFAAGVVMDS